MDTKPDSRIPLVELSPELSKALQARVLATLGHIIQQNSSTIYFAESTALDGFRRATSINGEGPEAIIADTHLSQLKLLTKFRSSVPLTTYDDYRPFVNRLLDPSAHVGDLANMLSPGLPLFIAQTSGTSTGTPKLFLKYPNAMYPIQPWDDSSVIRPLSCSFSGMKHAQLLDIKDLDGNVAITLPMSHISVAGARVSLGIGPKDDELLMDKKAAFSTSPFAVGLIPSYYTSTYMHAFFAIMDPDLIVMSATFSTLLYDAVRILVDNWSRMVQAVEDGKLPDINGLENYRAHLEPFVKPHPERARQLRSAYVGSTGWLKGVWPRLEVVMATMSGPYASTGAKLRHHFGPDITIRSMIYGATEGLVALGCDAKDTNLYRLWTEEHFEFLEVKKKRSLENLCQAWELVAGRKYEIYLTTHDGLWRYALGDIIEFAGFSAGDGQPLIRYSERQSVGFRVWAEFVAESTLQKAISSAEAMLGSVLEFTTELDERKFTRAYGFFVELAGELGPEANLSLSILNDVLRTNEGYKKGNEFGTIGNPTIRIVAPGTFSAYREWRVQTTGVPSGQVKVPVTIIDTATMEWLAERVIMEVGA